MKVEGLRREKKTLRNFCSVPVMAAKPPIQWNDYAFFTISRGLGSGAKISQHFSFKRKF